MFGTAPVSILSVIPPESEPHARTRLVGLGRHRPLLPHRLRRRHHRDPARAAEGRRGLGRLLPRGPERGVVRDRRLALRIEHRERAPRRPRRERGRGGRGAGSVRGPRLDHPPDPRLGLRAVLHQERRLHDAGVPRTPLLAREPVVPRDSLDRSLRPHQNLGDDLRRRRRLPRRRRAVLDRRAHRRHRDGGIHRLRRTARRALHRPAPDVRADRRLARRDAPRARRRRRVERAHRVRAGGLPRHVEAGDGPGLPVDRHPLRRAHPRRVVLVHGSVHRAAHALGEGRGQRPARDDPRGLPEAAAALHLRRARE